MNTLGDTDENRVKSVFTAAGCPDCCAKIENVERLGDAATHAANTVANTRPRPIKVTLMSNEIQRKIITNAKSLKDIPDYKDIYIKKDTHPAIRHEYGRLLKKEKAEKDKPNNASVEIKFDRKQRVLLRNNVVIDRFNPSFQ